MTGCKTPGGVLAALIVVAAALAVNVSASCFPPPAGLIGWWPGDGDANDLASANNGLLAGGATASGAGFVGSAFSFDGTNSYVRIPDSPMLRPTNLTIEAWVRFSSLDSAGSGGSPPGDQYLIFKQNSRSGGFEGFDLGKTRVANNDVFLFLVTSATGQSAAIYSSTLLAAGVWYHVAAVRGSNFMQLYVNGNLESQTSVGFPQDYGAWPLYFGTSGQSYWDHKFKGLLDEVSLYNRALSSNEVAAIYTAGATGKCKALIGPSIATQPQSQSIVAGNSAAFTVAAGGSAPLGYQWRKNDANLADGGNLFGANGVALILDNVQTNEAANYNVVVTNLAGSVTSAVAMLTVMGRSSSWPWETADIGAVWSDSFNRAALGSNWVILGSANAGIVSNELCFVQTNQDSSRQVYYQPWLTCASAWTLRWTQRFGTVDAGSLGVGVGIKNFQPAGGASSNDRGYNALLSGAGSSRGCMQIERWDGTAQVLAASGPAFTLAAGDIVDCSLSRSGWTVTATARNRTHSQVSSTSIVFSQSAGLVAPTISRACFYPLGGTVYCDDVSFTLDRRKPARFIVIGSSTAEGYNATSYDRAFVSVVQSNFNEAVCNDSGSWSSLSNAVSVLPEILAHQPETAIILIGANDLRDGYPASQWQGQYSLLAAQLLASGVRVKYCLPTPQNIDLSPLLMWISNTYPVGDLIDTWTPLVQPGGTGLRPAYDSGDGIHGNDAGHLLIGLTIISNLPPGIRAQPQNLVEATGGSASFRVAATGAAPLAYQWQFNGANIVGATGSSLALNGVQATNAGGYTVIVTGMGGSVTSAVATLAVVLPHFESVSLLPDRTLLLRFDAVSNLAYRIDASTDLVCWTSWTNIPAANGTLQFNDPGTTNFSKCFYRAVWVP